MSETEQIHQHNEITSLERTARLAQAANEVGGKVVILANQGETYTHESEVDNVTTEITATVPENNAYISLEFPAADATPLYDRARQIADANFLAENGIDPNSIK